MLLLLVPWLVGSCTKEPDAPVYMPDAVEEAATDQNDPRRFKVVDGSLVEDAATGIVREIPQGASPESLEEAFTADSALRNDDLRSDLRDGRGPRPSRLIVDGISVDAEVWPIGLDANRALAVPRRADVTGWWSGGFAPGEVGPTVIVGHYDSKTAPGVFARLKDVEEGELITVEQNDGSAYFYRVVQVDRLKKTAFPTDRVYGATPASTLRLVTCGGKFDRKTGHYVDNVIAYADLVSVTAPSLELSDDAATAIFGPSVGITVPTTSTTTTTTTTPTTTTASSTTTSTTLVTTTTATTTTATTTTATPTTSTPPTSTASTSTAPAAPTPAPPSAPGSDGAAGTSTAPPVAPTDAGTGSSVPTEPAVSSPAS